MKARQKRRNRRCTAAPAESAGLAELSRISARLDRLQAPVNPDVLFSIDDRLSRIESGMDSIRADASRRGAVAGAVAGSIVTTAILLIKARLGL
ncbi:hypothetical protein EHW64_13665 [Erwinia psidii]|uniref:hypothetical protein n=1 Tax=Erwinia psidii TaxID=69224 RepID=UPI00226B62EF|nr:hypothetical protein [Erwinia psidii]MCX8962150.1 hypothetical protein [Erwinia psidii]